MKSLLTLLACLLIVFASQNIASGQTLQLTVANQHTSAGTFIFDIYMQATSGTVYLAGADLVLTFNSGNFTGPTNTKGLNATFVLNNTNGDNTTSSSGTVGPLYRSNVSTAAIVSNEIIINLNALAPGDQATFDSDVAKIDNTPWHFGTYTISGVSNAAGSMGLAWKTVGAGVKTQVATFTNTAPWIASMATLSTPVITPDKLLPVELVNFTALARGRNIDLSWATKTETNNYGFEVQRSVSSQNPNWEKVGFIEGKGTTNAPQSYKYSDVVKSAGTFTYRLKQTDRDGKFTYSPQVEAKAALTAADYKMSQNYPNPFNPSTKFNFAVSTPQHVSVKVFNSVGQEVQTLFNGIAPADQIQEVTFDGARLASGIYFYVLRAQDRVEVKKMMMMK